MAAKPAAASSGAPAQGGRTVSPAELRTALAALDRGQAAVRVEQSDMHDAAEVLAQILECLHRAEAGTSAGPGSAAVHDITLPLKVKQASAGRSPAPSSTVHRLFGIDVQTACPVTDSTEEDGRKMSRNQRSSNQLPSMQQSVNAPAAATTTGDVLQFTKFFHLVPAQGVYTKLLTPVHPCCYSLCTHWITLDCIAVGSSSPFLHTTCSKRVG